jgi:hypothetical protein
MRLRGVRLAVAFVMLCLSASLAQRATFAADVHTIQGSIIRKEGSKISPLSEVVLLLRDEAGSVVAVTATDDKGQYHFKELTTGVYQVVAVDPPGGVDGDALPGRNAVKIDRNTLQVTMAPDVTQYSENNFIKILSQVPPRQIERLLAVGDGVDVKGQLGIYDIAPVDLDQGEGAIRRITDDGSLFVLDPAGTALLRLDSTRTEILLDTTARDPLDKVALTRLLRVETSRDGISAVVALRADNTRGIYRLEKGVLTRLGLLPVEAAPLAAELAISASGQIAFVAANASGLPALFQTVGGRPIEVVRFGQEVDGVRMLGFIDLTANDSGDLAFSSLDIRPDRTLVWVVVRKTRAGVEVVAKAGDIVERSRGAGITVPLGFLYRPRIGPDGIVVFVGTADPFSKNFLEDFFVNYFVIGPGRPLQPMLPGHLWLPELDYEIGADGAVAIRTVDPASSRSLLFLVAPTGGVTLIAGDRRDVQPVGRPAFGPGGLVFFQAKNPEWPPDRNSRIPTGLFRYHPDQGVPVAVAVPGQAVPGKPDQQLLGVPQRPAVSADTVAFTATFGGSDRFPVPTTGLFRVPLGGTVADGAVLAAEGAELPFPAQVVALRDFYYTADGTLLLDAFVRKGLAIGQLIATLTPRGSPASGAGTQAVEPLTPTPLLVKGDDLGAGRKLTRVLGRLVALPPDRHLFVAEYSQDKGAGEGLFTVNRTKHVEPVAVKEEPALGPTLANTRFIGFGETPRSGDTTRYLAYSPVVSSEGNVVFKARLERREKETFGVFQWAGAAPTAVAVTDPEPDDLASTADDRPPYRLEQWGAGPSGRTLFLERHQTRSGTSQARLFERSAAGLRPFVVAGQTQVVGGAPLTLTDLSDFVVTRAGEVFVHGAAAGASRVLAVGPTGLTPVAGQGQPVPPMVDGKKFPGLVFDGSFALVPESVRGDLFFRAGVWKPGNQKSRTRGIFHRTAQGAVETLLLENLVVGAARSVDYVVIASSSRGQGSQPFATFAPSQSGQVGNETFAFAARSSDGRWAIYRSRVVRDANTGTATLSIVLIAREGQKLPDGTPFVSLDPSLLLGRPIDSGPVFRLNTNGDVAFLASDGIRWGIYQYSDRP